MNERPDYDFLWRWHIAINKFSDGKAGNPDWPHFMYLAKNAADELPRLAFLFRLEREGKLAKRHYQCSHDATGQDVQDNHLTCALGVQCRACPYLLALENASEKPEEIDQMKAWTCVTHIVGETARRDYLDSSEGFVQTVDDQMYWSTVYANLAAADNGNGDEE